MVKPPEPRFVEIQWIDAWADGVDDVTFETVADKHQPLVMHTRGWLLLENDTGVSLFYERCLSPLSYRGRTFIPRGMIRSIEDFPAKKPRRAKPAKPVVTPDASHQATP